MKVGREEMIGLLKAVERYLSLDHEARMAGFEETVQRWIAALSGIPGVKPSRGFPNEAGQPVPRCLIEIDPAVTGMTAAEVRQRLWDGDPAIAVPQLDERTISITPDVLDGDEDQIILDRLKTILAKTLVSA